MLSCVIHRVLKRPGMFAAAGMMYVSLSCAAIGSAARNRIASASFFMACCATAFALPSALSLGGGERGLWLSSRGDICVIPSERREQRDPLATCEGVPRHASFARDDTFDKLRA